MSEVKVNKISPRTNCGTVTVGDSGDSVSVSAGVPVTVNGDLKSNALKATDGGSIISQSGTTITLGASGDTITLASGASQTGFGRTGTVDWDTTAKTASFTAVSGNGYFINTTSSAITVTLPSSPSAGDIVAVKDYAATFATNNCTIGRNSSNIGGVGSDLILDTDEASKTFVYVDGTQGWLVVNDATASGRQAQFVTATGGTVTTCGNFKIHKFTGPGTFCVSCAGNPLGSSTVDYMVVAGGAGAGNNYSAGGSGGGGGAGGWRASSGTASGSYNAGPSPLTSPVSALPVSASPYPITVGGGGAGGPYTGGVGRTGSAGSNSIFSTVTSAGGGPGGGVDNNGGNGGSGGGAGPYGGGSRSGGSGNTPPVSPPQGNDGAGTPVTGPGGGGGGAGSAASGTTRGNSVTSFITASPVAYAEGGTGGGSVPAGSNQVPARGNNTGHGGDRNGGGGGSGIVVIRYKFQ
jgi:hypothetical protein